MYVFTISATVDWIMSGHLMHIAKPASRKNSLQQDEA
jgi:hypothetical protein